MGVAVVIWFVLTIAVFNLLLGVAIAIGLELALAPRNSAPTGAPHDATLEAARQLHASAAGATNDDDATPAVDGAGAAAAAPRIDEIPVEWLELLSEEAIVAQGFLEASLQVLRLRVNTYRESLLDIETRLRDARNQAEIHAAVGDIVRLNEDWLTQQNQALSGLTPRRGQLGDLESTGAQLEDSLLEQTAQIQITNSNLEMLALDGDSATAIERCLDETSHLVDMAHQLRDRMQESVLTVLRLENRADQTPPDQLLDTSVGMFNSIGLDAALAAWRRLETAPQRVISLSFIDLDHFSGVNRRFGGRVADQALRAIARLLDELIRSDRGFDRLARVGGKTFALLLGDTGPRHATSTVERIRQTLAATTFEFEGVEFNLACSCGVVEVGPRETAADLIRRAHRTLHQAKADGGNQTCLDEGSGPRTIDPPQYAVRQRTVTLSIDRIESAQRQMA